MMRVLMMSAVLLLSYGGWGIPESRAQAVQSASLRKPCQDHLKKHLENSRAGYFYYVEDPQSTKSNCGWSWEDPGEFDRYPSAEQTAFTYCQNAAGERSIQAQCYLIAKGATIVAGSYEEAKQGAKSNSAGSIMATDSMRCGQTAGSRFYWVERAFCDLPVHGPEKAQGIVIWNHGISGTNVQYAAPAALTLRLLQARGWDAVKLNRHNLGEGDTQRSLSRSVDRTLEEVKFQRKLGYRKVVVAGQSFGGWISLETAETSGDVFAVVAMAPGVRHGGAGSLDVSITDRLLQWAKGERLAVIFPKDDVLFGKVTRGESALRALAGRKKPYLVLDETSGLVGHGGGTGGNFALRYGMCLVEFLSAPSLPEGRFVCTPQADQWTVAKELLPKPPKDLKVVTDSSALPESIRGLEGLWWGLLGETIVSFALVDSGEQKLRAMYGWASGNRGGRVQEVEVAEEQLKMTFSNKATAVVKRVEEGKADVTYTASGAGQSDFSLTGGGGSGVWKATLVRVKTDQ